MSQTRRTAKPDSRPSPPRQDKAPLCTGTNLFCPICGHEFLPEEIGKKPHCRRCGYLESCCNPE